MSDLSVGTAGHGATPASPVAASAPVSSLRPDTAAPALPFAGMVLMAALIALAVVLRWRAARAVGPVAHLPGGAPRWARWLRRGQATDTSISLQIEASVRLDGSTSLHAVRWGGRRMLIAATQSCTPIVIDRDGATGPQAEDRPA